MKIRIVKNPVYDYGILWAKHIKVFILSFGWYSFQASFGKKPFDPIEYRDFLNKTFNKDCGVCHKPLNVNDVRQKVFWHKECRKLRHKVHGLA